MILKKGVSKEMLRAQLLDVYQDSGVDVLSLIHILEAKVTFFKGMYSDLTDRSICLKLWNGEKWIWTDCNLKGRPLPQEDVYKRQVQKYRLRNTQV